MENEEDEELERIKAAKLQKMMTSAAPQKRGTDFNRPVGMTDSTFKEMILNHPLVVVDCWARWCGPCRMVAPIIEELSRDYVGKILFGKLDVDENREVSMQYDIMSIPTLLVFKNGKLVDTIIGAMPRQTLEQKITRHF
jgi:thioredoxin 1